MSLAKELCQLLFQAMRNIEFVIVFCVVLLVLPTKADGSRMVKITEAGGIYSIEISAKMYVEPNYVRDVLLDITHVYRLNPSIIESEVLESKISNEARVRTRVLCCVPAFCREVERVDIIRILLSGEIQSEIIPDLSDFSSGKAVWKIVSLDDGYTHLYYQESIEPGFYIPPMLGVNLLKKQFNMTFDRIEYIARVNAKRERVDNFSPVQPAFQNDSKPYKASLSSADQ